MRVAALVCTAGLLALVGACRDATSITLEVTTDVPCAGQPLNVGIAAAYPGELEGRAFTAETSWCDRTQTHVGSLVLVPSDGDEDPVAVRVVGAVGRDPALCKTGGGEGCIVVNLRLRYVPHENQRVTVQLASACLGVACASDATCVAGACRPVPDDTGTTPGDDAGSAATGDGGPGDRDDAGAEPDSARSAADAADALTCPVVPQLVLCCGKLSCVGSFCTVPNECSTCTHKCTDPSQPMCCVSNKVLADGTHDVACKHVTDTCPPP